MPKIALTAVVGFASVLGIAHRIFAADFNFFGRSGDAIEINLGNIPGIASGSSFTSLNLAGFASHTVVTSDTLTGQAFSSSGRLWVFANPARNTAAQGDTNVAARGFQGTLTGSVLVNGVSKSFSVTVAPGYTGAGAGSVGQSAESQGRAANNWLYVAQQQQRLRYFGFVQQGGGQLVVDGDFGPNTNAAVRTFQAAIIGGVNTTQANADGIIGPNTAGWLNALNAPTWNELIDPDPQPPGTYSTSRMIGDFDILPGPDPGTGAYTGNTPAPERFAVNYTIDLIKKGSAKAKLTTGRTQRVNALTAADGYASSCCHDTHRVGTDIDLYTDQSTWNWGNGTRSNEEQIVINHAVAFATAGATGKVIRFITSNQDIYDGIHAALPSMSLYYDTTGVHQNHLHIDVGPPSRIDGIGNLAGDFNLDDVVDARDYVIWRANVNKTLTQSDYNQWRANFGKTITNRPIAAGADYEEAGGGLTLSPVPEPATAFYFYIMVVCLAASHRCSRRANSPGRHRMMQVLALEGPVGTP